MPGWKHSCAEFLKGGLLSSMLGVFMFIPYFPANKQLFNHLCDLLQFLQAARDDKRKGISFTSELKKLTKSSKQYRGLVSDSPQGRDERAACALAFSDIME